MTLYLDANVFILASIGEGEKADNARAILKKIIMGESKGITASLTIDEIVWAILKETKDRTIATEQGLRVLQFDNLKIVSIDGQIMKKSLELMQKYTSLKPRDAIHAVVAINERASIIVSDDADFDVVKEIKRKSLTQV